MTETDPQTTTKSPVRKRAKFSPYRVTTQAEPTTPIIGSKEKEDISRFLTGIYYFLSDNPGSESPSVMVESDQGGQIAQIYRRIDKELAIEDARADRLLQRRSNR